jgi:hypothetical protein
MLKNILLALCVLAHTALFADTSQGEELETKMWNYIKDRKWDELANQVAPYFQSALFEGAENKEQFLNRVKVINIGNFVLSNFQVTEAPDVIIVTYDISVTETIRGQPIASKAVRLSVWQKNDNNWQWIAHAALIPVPAAKANQ